MSVALSNNFVKTDEPGGAHRNRVVALGGGHGLSATLKALRSIDIDPTAVVTVADDGGSSGRLRREFDCLRSEEHTSELQSPSGSRMPSSA